MFFPCPRTSPHCSDFHFNLSFLLSTLYSFVSLSFYILLCSLCLWQMCLFRAHRGIFIPRSTVSLLVTQFHFYFAVWARGRCCTLLYSLTVWGEAVGIIPVQPEREGGGGGEWSGVFVDLHFLPSERHLLVDLCPAKEREKENKNSSAAMNMSRNNAPFTICRTEKDCG